MPILALGPNGQLYQTSPDREDGLGFGAAPEVVEQGDLTLGNAYLKANAQRTRERLEQKRVQRLIDADDKAAQERARLAREGLKKRAIAEARMYENPNLMEAVTKKALRQGVSSEYATVMDGNVMTHNGMNGWNGMCRDQQAIHNAVLGMGRNVAHAVDKNELRQAQMKAEAERILRLGARR